MRKRSGAIIFSAIVITVIVMFCLFPVVREFIDAIAALVTLIGVLITIFTVLHPSENEKEKAEKETIGEGAREEVHIEEEIHIPSPISGLCLGRDTELSKLEEDLTRKNVLLIKGIAGIGKTTLGLKFRGVLLDSKKRLIRHCRVALGTLDTPSEQDQLLTQQLCLSGKILDVEVIDHVIIGFIEHVSLKDKGLM